METAAKQAIFQRRAVQKQDHDVIYDAEEVSGKFSFQPKISVYLDPTLEWGHRALLDVLVRGADLHMVWPRMTLLMLFFAVTLLISRSFYHRN